MKLGDRVLAQGTIRRTGDYSQHGRAEVYWAPRIWKEAREGIFIGWRCLSNGEIKYYYDSDEAPVYHPKEYFKVALVVFNERANPRYVPLNLLHEVGGED